MTKHETKINWQVDSTVTVRRQYRQFDLINEVKYNLYTSDYDVVVM